MILELKNQIDTAIKFSNINLWITYEEAKKEIRDYEVKNKVEFTPKEYGKYINYIINKLNI